MKTSIPSKSRPVSAVVMLLLALSLALPGAAQTGLTVQALYDQAAEGWHETYRAHGRTVTVDIKVQVPVVGAFPILRVTYAQPGAAEGSPREAAGGAGDGGPYVLGPAESPYFRQAETPSGHPQSELRLEDAYWDISYAENNPMTLEAADSLMREKLALLFGEDARMELCRILLNGRLRRYDEKARRYAEPIQDMGSYTLCYTQTLCGIPVLGRWTQAQRMEARAIEGTVYTENDLQASFILMREAGMLAQDSPLCAFETVKASYEPLIEKGQIRNILSMRLGYVCYQDREDSQVFRAVPSWVAECEWHGSPQEEPPPGDPGAEPGYRQIIVNAQTGELVGLVGGSRGREGAL